jgi:L-threonylcarbamoyladenylate synthase
MISKVVEVLKNGGVVIFPTDTVWGMGVAADNPAAIKKFYKIKKREPNKPTAVLIADLAQAEELGEFDDEVREVAKKYWPGALTLVIPGKGDGTIGLRVPDWPLVQELCRKLGAGILAGSANFAGEGAPVKREELNPELVKLVDWVMPPVAEAMGGQPASTVVDTTTRPWKILRQGAIKVEW